MVTILAIKSVIKFILFLLLLLLSAQGAEPWNRPPGILNNSWNAGQETLWGLWKLLPVSSLCFFSIMEMRPIGRKKPLLSKNTVYAFPKRKDLEIEHKAQVTSFYRETYFVSLDVTWISTLYTSCNGCFWGLRDGANPVFWSVTE